MLANEATWRPSTPRVRFFNPREGESSKEKKEAMGDGRSLPTDRANCGGRTGARGSFQGPVWSEKGHQTTENFIPRKRKSEEAGVGNDREDDLKDTTSSPVKPMGEEGRSKEPALAQKQLFCDYN